MYDVRIHGYLEGEGNNFDTYEQALKAAKEWFFDCPVTWYCTIKDTVTDEVFYVFWWKWWHIAKVAKPSVDSQFSMYHPLGDRNAAIYWEFGEYYTIEWV